MSTQLRLFAISSNLEKSVFLVLSIALAFSIPFKAIYNSILCIALLIFWIFFMRKSFDYPRLKMVLGISILFWVALIGMFYTKNFEEGLFRLQQKSLLLLLPAIFITISVDWQKEFKWIVSFFILGVLMACIVCLINASVHLILYNGSEKFFSHDLTSFIDLYPYIMSTLCLAAILCLVEVGLGKLEVYWFNNSRLFLIILILFLSLFIFLLSVKQIIIAWLGFIIFYSVRMNRNKIIAIVMVAFGFLIAGTSISFIPTLKAKLDEIVAGKDNTIPLDQDASLERGWNGIAMRKAVWTCSIDAINQNPWIGVGTGDGQDALQIAYENRQFYFASRFNRFNTHNQYLQVIVNYGFLGFFLWLSSLFYLLKISRSNGLAIALIFTLVFAMLTESMLETNKGVLLMAFLLSFFSVHTGIISRIEK